MKPPAPRDASAGGRSASDTTTTCSADRSNEAAGSQCWRVFVATDERRTLWGSYASTVAAVQAAIQLRRHGFDAHAEPDR